MSERRRLPEISTVGERVLGLDFTKYLLSSDKRRLHTMDTDNTTGTESDLSDWELGQRYHTSENSEESDDYGIYYNQSHVDALSMFDTAIGSEPDQFERNRQYNLQVENILAKVNPSMADSGYSGSLYPIHEGSTVTDSSGSHDENSEGTLSNSGSPVHHPVYGSYHKLQSQIDEARRMETDGSLERLMLHRLPGEYLGMILGIEGGKEGNGKVTSVCVKSVTLGGAAHRATGSSKGMCVSDEIVEVNGLDLHTLTHDECVQVFKDMPLRVILGIRRGQQDIPPVAISPLPMEKGKLAQRQNSDPAGSPRFISPRELSDSENDGFAGFALYQVNIEKDATENLGLSIVPSYGSTKQYYQIKRILPSGAAARSEQLQVGDRLITCNGKNLRGLTQNHCLNIIRATSLNGDVAFEIIRPVYNGSSMEISVTVNPNSQKNPYIQPYDSQQYSLKSQSYDRNVDVVVTSESEDYLTVSEDEYSRTGRLANIPEVEANEVFASNSVKLAFQKPYNSIEEESTSTETETESVTQRHILSKPGIDIIDLNKGDNSPYHIPKRPTANEDILDSRKGLEELPKTDIDKVSLRSPRSPRYQQIEQTDIDTVSVSTVSPRSPVQKSDIEKYKIKSVGQVSPLKTDTSGFTKPSYNKRQQVPVDEQVSISPPFIYPTESINRNIPTDNLEAVRYNPLYDSETTDSETVQDIYIPSLIGSPARNSKLNNSYENKEYVSARDDFDTANEVEIALPPPIEFSDNQNKVSVERLDYSPVTNIDDLASSSVEVSPIHQEITVIPSYRKPNNSVVKLEKSFRDLEEASSDKPQDVLREYSDSELAFSNELTAPFDSVLQEHGECVHTSVPVEFTDPSNSEILKVVQSFDDGTIVISQFDANDSRESTDSPTPYKRYYTTDTRMDTNSEAMLKDALDMEYDQLPETDKHEMRIGLGGNVQLNQIDLEEDLASGRNIVAEKLAKEMVQRENGNYGYYMESDDEPDQFPGEDEPEPALPDAPPPVLMTLSNDIGEAIHEGSVTINGRSVTPTITEHSTISNESNLARHHENKIDSNWSFRSREPNNGNENGLQDEENDVIIPVSVKRKVDIVIDNLNVGQQEEEEVVIPQKIERNFSMPKDFKERDILTQNELVKAKKSAPPVAPKPSKSNLSPRSPVDENFNFSREFPSDDSVNLEPVKEDVFTAVDISEQRKKNIVNVISVVNALRAAKVHEEPDVVDRVVKVDKKDYFKKSVGAMINVGNSQEKEKDPVISTSNIPTSNAAGQILSPRNEVIVNPKKEIKISKPKSEISVDTLPNYRQASPPKQEVIVTTKKEIVNSKSILEDEDSSKISTSQTEYKEPVTVVKDSVIGESKTVPITKTSISVEKPDSSKNLAILEEPKGSESLKSNIAVPPLNLNSLNDSNADLVSPTSNKSDDLSPSSSYRTTIGVNKGKPNITSTDTQTKSSSDSKPSQQFKPLSAIKPLSFNPKSLSQTLPARSVQYKTTINTVVGKPSGLTTLGRSSLLSTQKTDHPIKRMETMPFEVSILKGILGIGIKTTMTPEGFVQVSEILPSGPVGREGNIKVGDYLLSINGTQLTGLPDSKVQQTLRLLPRGLSKLVASAVPPDPSTAKPPAEKSKLTPQQSMPLSSLRKTTVTANPEPLTISTRKSLTNTKSLPTTMLQKSKDEKSPQISPRSPKDPSNISETKYENSTSLSPRSKTAPTTLPKPKDRTSPRGETSPRSPVSESSVSPITSPRQPSAVSPRSPPPPVAPKPARNQTKPPLNDDQNKPIETVILASVNSSKVEAAKPGPNILPGSVNYDYTEPVSKITRKGEVSSAELKPLNVSGNESGGKIDVVRDTITQNENKLTNDSPLCNELLPDSNVEQNNNIVELDATKSSVSDATGADASFEAIVKDLSEKSEVDLSLFANRNRSFSVSSDNESYTDFNECNVEENNIPTDIVEVDEAEVELVVSAQSPRSNGSHNMKPEEYESDFEEFTPNNVDKTKAESNTNVDTEAMRGMAENIVAEVISSVKEMDFNKGEEEGPPPIPYTEPPIMVEESSYPESAPPIPNEPPPLPTEAPPPIPSEAPPLLSTDSQMENRVVDLNLNRDDSLTNQSLKNSRHEDMAENESQEVIDVVSSYHSAQLHASNPQSNVVHTTDTYNSGANDKSFSKQVLDTAKNQSNFTEERIVTNIDNNSVNTVIDLYSDIGTTKLTANNETAEVDNNEEKPISNIQDFLTNSVSSDLIKDSVAKSENNFMIKEKGSFKGADVNGDSGHSSDAKDKLVTPSGKRKDSDGTSLSPRSDSAYSPRTAESVTSEDEGHGRYTPDVDKVIRMLSQSEEPIDKGEGETLVVTINKGVTGLGFVIEGGKMSVKGDLPISIKRIFKGGPAENHLQVGDEISEVNGEDISQMRRTEAWNHLKFLPSGDITMKIRRYHRERLETVV